ncbi:MAG: purine-nucleoside phosphorylase [candidate division KSB1 bacterium]|nr:purine-nucleoside phosphorylase [candidate division KSB1 bacterium]
MNNELKRRVAESVAVLREKGVAAAELAVILGSGLGSFAELLADPIALPTTAIPHHPQPTVPGHAGRWVYGRLGDVHVLALQGRVHYYEGYTIQQVGYPVHVLAELGVKGLIVTTASGGLNPAFAPGDIMLIVDHINFGFANPLIGPSQEQLGPRFPDMSEPYDRRFTELARQVGMRVGLPLRQGVFCWLPGPSYETAAEVQMLRRLGADAASMSTVPEVVVARQRGMRVLGLSCITNLATGLSPHPLSHEEVTAVAEKVRPRFNAFLQQVALAIAAELRATGES